jgi:hypothetical protein
VVSIAYVIDGYAHPSGTSTDVSVTGGQTDATTFPDYIGYDLALTVFPAEGGSPCPGLYGTLFLVLPDEFVGASDGTCQKVPNGRWQYSAKYDANHLTQVERIGDYDIALTVDTGRPGRPSGSPYSLPASTTRTSANSSPPGSHTPRPAECEKNSRVIRGTGPGGPKSADAHPP